MSFLFDHFFYALSDVRSRKAIVRKKNIGIARGPELVPNAYPDHRCWRRLRQHLSYRAPQSADNRVFLRRHDRA